MALAAGQLRAPTLRDSLFSVGYLLSDASVFSIDVLTEASGLAVAMEPSSSYALDGYIAYDTAAAAQLKLSFDIPPGASGDWGAHGTVSSSSNIGVVNGYRTGFGLSHYIGLGGASGGSACVVRGFVQTVPGGAMRLLFCQYTATASATAIRAGSWLRLSKLS